jgi:cell division protease FtsH
MRETFGFAAVNQSEPHPFLSNELSEPRNFSKETAREIDEDVKSSLDQCREKAATLLGRTRAKRNLPAESLIEEATLSAEQINHLFR